MPNNSPTEAGPSETVLAARRTALIDAINQVFTLFRLNYHNQYLKAFGNTAELNEVKRLWLEMLSQFDAQTLLRAAKAVIETSEYLPTLRTMIHHCERTDGSPQLPDPHSAYQEACRAPSPKAAFAWSHPAVYHAGKRADWYFLQTQAESKAYPVFREIYEELCEEVRRGATLDPPSVPALTAEPSPPLDKDTNLEKLKALRNSLKL